MAITSCCLTSYTFEILCYLKEKEKHLPRIAYNSPQLKRRPELIEWLRHVSLKMKLTRNTLHLGVLLLDNFMDRYDITHNLYPICWICLVIAAKYEGGESTIPKLTDLFPYVDQDITKEGLADLEVFVLESFGWNARFVTAATFAGCYSLFAVLKGDLNRFGYTRHYLQDIVQSGMMDYLDNSLSDDVMNQFFPSKIAATCLLAARRDFKMVPLWPEDLTNITGYTLSDLKTCLNVLRAVNKNYLKDCLECVSESDCESCTPENLSKKPKLDDS